MSELFDKEGDGDDDLKALEERLQAARYQKPVVSWEQQAVARPSRRWGRVVAVLAAAAAVLVALSLQLSRGPSMSVTTASGVSQLPVGDWLVTKETSTIQVEKIGQVTVEPDSRVRVRQSTAQRQWLELDRGALHASVTAPPRLFVVDTPAVSAVDLGCEYFLSVEPSGATRLEVLKGEVSLEGHGATSRVSAGSVCLTEKGQAPGVPRSKRAGPSFQQALGAWETHQGGLEPVLASAEKDDTESLWNLLPRVSEPEREVVLARVQGLIDEPPKDVSPAGIRQLEGKAMESLWQALP